MNLVLFWVIFVASKILETIIQGKSIGNIFSNHSIIPFLDALIVIAGQITNDITIKTNKNNTINFFIIKLMQYRRTL